MNLAAKFGSTTGATKVTVKNKTTGVETGDEEDLPASGGGFEFKLGWRF
jgi:hypothetical protein